MKKILLPKLFLKISLVLFLVIGQNLRVKAQLSNKGNDFWMMFTEHVNENNAQVSLYITSDSTTSGTVSIPGANWSTNFTVTANDLTVVDLPRASLANNCSDCIAEKAINITSVENVVIFAHKYFQYRSDASLILPTRTLEKEYYVMSYNPRRGNNTANGMSASTFGIVAHKDSTIIRITPTAGIVSGTNATTISKNANTPFQIRLDRGEVYYARGVRNAATGDLTGTKIEVIDTGATADCRTIAVFSGTTNTAIHDHPTDNCPGTTGWGSVNSRDNIYQQLFPASSWGNNFIMVPLKNRGSYNYRIVAKENNTRITVLPGAGAPRTINLDAGEYETEYRINTTIALISDKPISVAQYQQTARCNRMGGAANNQGDPSISIINPLEQTLEDITVYSSRFENITQHHINVLIPTYARNSFRIDGNPVTFTNVPRLGSWSYAQITVTAGNHRMIADVGFIAIAYGYGQYESYSYAAGANVRDLRAQIKLANSVQNDRQVICLGDSASFSGEAEYQVTKYEWFFGDGDTSQAQSIKHAFKDTGVYEVKLYTYKPSFDGCSNYDSTFMTVYVYGKPEARIRTENLCDSSTALFFNESYYPPGESQQFVRWEFDPGEFKYDDDVSRDYDSAGRYPITLIVTSWQNCASTYSDSITVSPHPVPSFLRDSICFKDAHQIINTSTVSSGTITQNIWAFENNDTLYDTEPTYFFNTAGNHPVILTTTTDSGCTKTYIDTIHKYGDINASFTFNDTCLGFNTIFNNTSSLVNGAWTDTIWRTSDGDEFDTWDLDKEFTTDGTKTITLIMEQNGECTDTMIQNIAIHPLPNPSFTSANFCFGDETEFTNTSTSPTANWSSSWDLNQGPSITTEDAQLTYNSSGKKMITLSINTDDGCTVSKLDSIYIRNTQILGFLVNQMCSNESQLIEPIISLDQDSVTNYAWTIDGNTFSGNQVNFIPMNVGDLTLSLTITTREGCTFTETSIVPVVVAPTADFDVYDLCRNLPLNVTNNSTSDATNPINSQTWWRNGNQVSTAQNPVLTNSQLGNNTLKLLVQTSTGCKDSIEKTFVTFPVPVVSFNSDNYCLGDLTQFVSTTSINSGTLNTNSWDIDGNLFNGNATSYTFTSHGSFPIKLLVISDRDCRDSNTQNITIHPLPELDFAFDRFEACIPFTPVINNNSSIATGNIAEYTWNWGDGNTETISGTNAIHTYPTPGSYQISISTVSDQGCEADMTVDNLFIAHPRPTADYNFTPSENISVINARVSFFSESLGANEWNWRMSDGFNYTGESIQHEFKDSGVFNVLLTVSNDFGCRDSISKDLYVNADLFVHLANSFTPNGDLLNDQFGLFGLTQGVVDFDMKIFNRWGQLIYHSTDVNKPWDGTYKGEIVPQGQYLYRVKHTDPKRSQWYIYNGMVTVIP